MKSLLLLLSGMLISQIAISQAPAKQTVDLNPLAAVYNTNDSASYARFYASVSADPQKIRANVNQMKREFKFIGPVTLRKTEQVSPTETDLIFQTQNFGSWWCFMWITDSARNFKEHHMRPTRFSADFLLHGRLSAAEILDTVDRYVNRLVDKKLFMGNVLIARNNQVLYNKCFGKNRGGLNDADTRFDLASTGKLFTTVSILQLAGQHKLSLDDSVGKLMPQLSNKALFPITVRQLLNHTSGMGDYFEDPVFDPMRSGRKFTRADALPAVEKDKLRFPPGSSFAYSNTGFELLGLIVEKVSGMALEEYVKQNVFAKAGMDHTVFGQASGGSQATVGDMYNFAQALKANRLLDAKATACFFSSHTANWGLGQEYQQLGDEIITGHSGGFEGACTELNMYQKSGYTVVILSNNNPPYGHFLSDKIKEAVVRK